MKYVCSADLGYMWTEENDIFMSSDVTKYNR